MNSSGLKFCLVKHRDFSSSVGFVSGTLFF